MLRSHTFRGRRYRINGNVAPAEDGHCRAPRLDRRRREIAIDPTIQGLERLEVTIHESIHACCWYLDEEEVEETAVDLARFLWRLGYRRPKCLEVGKNTKRRTRS